MYSWLIKPFNDFLAMKQSNRLSHALLICGSSGLGINELTYDEAIKEIAKIIANNDNNEAIKVVKELIKEVKNQKIFPF